MGIRSFFSNIGSKISKGAAAIGSAASTAASTVAHAVTHNPVSEAIGTAASTVGHAIMHNPVTDKIRDVGAAIADSEPVRKMGSVITTVSNVVAPPESMSIMVPPKPKEQPIEQPKPVMQQKKSTLAVWMKTLKDNIPRDLVAGAVERSVAGQVRDKVHYELAGMVKKQIAEHPVGSYLGEGRAVAAGFAPNNDQIKAFADLAAKAAGEFVKKGDYTKDNFQQKLGEAVAKALNDAQKDGKRIGSGSYAFKPEQITLASGMIAKGVANQFDQIPPTIYQGKTQERGLAMLGELAPNGPNMNAGQNLGLG